MIKEKKDPPQFLSFLFLFLFFGLFSKFYSYFRLFCAEKCNRIANQPLLHVVSSQPMSHLGQEILKKCIEKYFVLIEKHIRERNLYFILF